MTKKQKLEEFDAIKAERDKLLLAIHSLTQSKFPFENEVKVDLKRDIDSSLNGYCRVWKANRANPLFMSRLFFNHQIIDTEFWHESEIDAHCNDASWFWRMMRHAVWLINQKGKR